MNSNKYNNNTIYQDITDSKDKINKKIKIKRQ